MDAKDLRTEAAIGERSKDGTNKYRDGGTLLLGSNKNYQNISSNPLDKLDIPTTRPCAVIGPDRVLPPSSISDAYIKKGHYETWPSTDNTYRHPPEYPHKMTNYPNPLRNISPRQTFQENMQRIMVPPTYNSINITEDANFSLDRNTLLSKNSKLNESTEPKYCDVPYSVNTISENQTKNTEMCVSNVPNSRNCPPMWHQSGLNMRPVRPYGASELYQYPEYTNCAGSRSMPMSRPQNAINENSSHLYTDTYYHQGNIRFRPYPNLKERYPQTRYDYINNYPNPYNTPPFPTQKFDLQKPLPPHPSYSQVPIKYLENRINDSVIDGYQRHPQQFNYNLPYQNQLIHPAYGPMLTNSLQNKLYSYPVESSIKTLPSNKVPYENSKVYLEYENGRSKNYSVPDSLYVNDMTRPHKSQVIYPTMNMQQIPPHPYYRKTSNSSKNYEYAPHLRHGEPSIITNNHLTRVTSEFSPITISPSESNTSIDHLHSQGNFEDFGYGSQSSTASLRSIESSVNRIMPGDFHRRFNYPFPHMVKTSPTISKSQFSPNNNTHSKDKKGLDIRQFLEMWNEGDEVNAGSAKDKMSQIDYNKDINKTNNFKNQELYVLGSVNVPSEELGKYEHIQKVSKLPDNIKGCNNIELLKHFEEVIESSNFNNFGNHKESSPRNFQAQKTIPTLGSMIPARPVSPLDVEAKISQSVIHKEVGCNFEIKPCSPEMLNVEAATQVQNVLGERIIEKVSNPYQSPGIGKSNNNINCNESKQIHVTKSTKTSSCKLVNPQCNDSANSIKDNYSFQDLESSSGVCLASLPRLDNDIELSFPEVNQQFINANKESVIISTELQNTSETKDLNLSNIIIEESSSINIITPSKEPEKEFAKLSKYRKNKKCESGFKDYQPLSHSQPIRTDSVIIKNPDNARSFEESDCSSNNLKNVENIQIESTNLNLNNVFESNLAMKSNDAKETIQEAPNEIAIDFSINKTHILTDTENNKYELDENNGFHKTDEKPINKNNNDLPPLTISYKDGAAYQTSVESVTVNDLKENSSKAFSKTGISSDETYSVCNSSENINTDAVNNVTVSLGQPETQLSLLFDEAQNNDILRNRNAEVNITEDLISKYNVEHENKSSQSTCGQSIASSHNECEQTIISEMKNDALLQLSKIEETQAEIIQYKLKNKVYCSKSQNNESVDQNDIKLSTTVEAATGLSNYEINKFPKRSILKKELFSPYIQKLLWCNEDIEFPSQSIIDTTENTKNIFSTDTNYHIDFVDETITKLDKENDLFATDGKTSLETNDSTDSGNKNMNESEKEYKSISTEEAAVIESDESFGKKGSIISIDDTIKSSIINTDHMLVDVVRSDVICDNNTQILDEEVNIGISDSLEIHRTSLKRSLSDSALINIIEDTDHESSSWSKKRRKNKGLLKICSPSFISASLKTMQNNRRKSISSTVYKEENLSFCIVIDNNCIITQENDEDDKINFAERSENCLSDVHNTQGNDGEVDSATDIILYPQENKCEYSEPFILEISDEKSLQQSWVDDIGCVETVVSDDVAEDVTISSPSSPKSQFSSEYDESQSDIFNSDHTEKVKYIYGDKMCNDDADLVETLYRTPQMNVNKTLTNREPHSFDDFDEYNDEVSLKNISRPCDEMSPQRTVTVLHNSVDMIIDEDRKISNEIHFADDINISKEKNEISELINLKKTQVDAVDSCRTNLDSVFPNNHEGESSSPEVSSTTPEEKNSTILLKITNYQGTRTSQLSDTDIDSININSINSCKFTESINYTNSSLSKPGHLITKAAQKYIPPVKETLDDLKVKLTLPQHSLMKLKQLKISKTRPKHINSFKKEISKKTKPKFEDVLKSIDEIQFKMHKERNKKLKKPVPKVVIKKNENGSHYTSASDNDYFNPDLTGRKWQPWVFIEKNYFIDKMAIKNKSKAIFNHRKNTFMLADKFHKYKSVSSAKFIISQPKSDNPSSGQLKYTIRLKHSN